ncbi:hypothetical protein I4U23_003616 [Adineta vaga]|nr:hypothetical protein I4U23_003616 [Adineta vaga]
MNELDNDLESILKDFVYKCQLAFILFSVNEREDKDGSLLTTSYWQAIRMDNPADRLSKWDYIPMHHLECSYSIDFEYTYVLGCKIQFIIGKVKFSPLISSNYLE